MMQFTATTLAMGRELSDTDSPTGYQDAITPPWQSNLALFTYASVLILTVLMWWNAGWLAAFSAFAAMFFGASIVRCALPGRNGPHFRNLILQSMCRRYADYVRDGDVMRADAMKHLLDRAGIPVPKDDAA
jgi:hypothetical protein